MEIWNKYTTFLAEMIGVKKRTLFWAILFALIIFFIQLNISYKYTKILENLELKADIEVEISPFLQEAPFGEYLPMIIINTGDFTFENVLIAIAAGESLGQRNFEVYRLPLLPAHSERVIPFGNKMEIDSFKKGNCYPFSGKDRSYASFYANGSAIFEGMSYNITSTGCGITYFNATILAEYRGENKTFKKSLRGYFESPIDLTFTINPS